MENEIIKRLDEQKKILEKIVKDTDKTNKYFLWTIILTVVFLVLPLIAIGFILPNFMNTYLSSLSGLSL
jgi:type II secretory pathway component PulF